VFRITPVSPTEEKRFLPSRVEMGLYRRKKLEQSGGFGVGNPPVYGTFFSVDLRMNIEGSPIILLNTSRCHS